ncbi:unnamed protein product [Parascedosporium putredinis]|uniref:DUF300-domain-containing protein n=1 Tax=Parascedosporium putredinis TaxID=1442378 RepID=A0A9P1M5V5_9PEZI|nr:unnamed protein product [Parascedosporium putredinis]CAI7987700.1 unnamed protein product [Parascedosporium putredinis]
MSDREDRCLVVGPQSRQGLQSSYKRKTSTKHLGLSNGPVNHLWPLNHVLPKVDISDPHTFLAIKRGILQYTWLKPLLALSAIIMKACGVYEEGYIGLKSGYFGAVSSITLASPLVFPKFLCIKLIIFASYWQGFFLSILVWVGAIPDNVEGYTPDNLAAAIQDALICVEMPAFAIAHWYAFSWKDFADNSIFSARMPLRHAFKDAFGPKDLIEDSKQTFMGDNYGYRSFDSGDKIIAHEDSQSRLARINAGMRYERGGKGKYWIPKPGESQASATTPLLGPAFAGSSRNGGPSSDSGSSSFSEEINLDPEEERLYGKARELEYGDWNRTSARPVYDPTLTTTTPPAAECQLLQAGAVDTERGSSCNQEEKEATPPQDTREEAPDADVTRPSKRTVDEPTREPLQASDENKAARPTPVQEERGSASRVEETAEEQTLSPGYQVSENDDEFRNVWD